MKPPEAFISSEAALRLLSMAIPHEAAGPVMGEAVPYSRKVNGWSAEPAIVVGALTATNTAIMKEQKVKQIDFSKQVLFIITFSFQRL